VACNLLFYWFYSVCLCLYIGLAVMYCSRSTSYSTPGTVNTWMGDSVLAGTTSRYVPVTAN